MNEIQMEQLIRSCGKDILRFCRITAGSADDGDELYQDTMLMLWQKRKYLDIDQNAKGYAISVALKLWKNRKRKLARRLLLFPQTSLEEMSNQGIQPVEHSPSPEDILSRKNTVHFVQQMVSELPEKYRLPIQMYYSADLSISDISKVLKLPENTVKSRLHRARQLIREKLEELEYERAGI